VSEPALDPRQRRTVDALLAAAEELFAERPAAQVTVAEIAARAGVAVGSIYNNFGSKSDLHAVVVERALDLDREYMDRAYTPDRPPLAQLRAAGEQYLRFYLDFPEHFRLLAFPGRPGSNPAARRSASRLAARVEEQNARMAAAIARGVADGSLRPVDPSRTATALWAGFNGVISLAWRPDELREDEAGIAALLALLTEALSWGLRADPQGDG
jgi:AcrR family transcriptional regulator